MSRKEWNEHKVSLGGALVCSFITLVIGVGIGTQWNKITSNFSPYLTVGKTEQKIDWSSLNTVYSELTSNYDGDIDKNTLIEGAKKGLVEAVGDVYTVYMSKDEASDFEKSLHGDVGAGVGIEMSLRENYVRVIKTLPDNPARKAGILAGDIIYKVDDEEVYDWTVDKIAEKVRGESGTKVKLTIVRDGQEKDFTMTREKINNVSADIEYDGKTAIITVSRFDTDTGKIVKGFAEDFKDKKINKVILDLRGNGGGYVSAAKDLLSLWIDGDKVLIQKSKLTGEDITYANSGEALLKDMKTVVLVNSTTASASEIVTGALQDYKKAKVIGETTYGKGVVQTLLDDLPGEAMLKVTTAHWYTPKDRTINKTGIKPDKEVVNSYDDINAGRDPQMKAAKAE